MGLTETYAELFSAEKELKAFQEDSARTLRSLESKVSDLKRTVATSEAGFDLVEPVRDLRQSGAGFARWPRQRNRDLRPKRLTAPCFGLSCQRRACKAGGQGKKAAHG